MKCPSKWKIANKNLSDSLITQFREENESLRKEFSSDLKAEILNLTGTKNQLRKDTDLEVASLSHSVEAVREKLNEEVNEHKGVVQRQIEKISQEMNKRTRDLDAELTGQITQAKNDVPAVRQEMVELREQINSNVTDWVRAVSETFVDCRNQIVTEKETISMKFQKVNQETDSLKARLAFKGGFTHSMPFPCRAHAVPLPCRSAKGLECVFPI
jgi:hypothetical protein